MTKYPDLFPTDVRFILEGDKEAANALVGEARNMYVKASLMQAAYPDTPVQLTRYLDNGGFINVVLIDTMKIITIKVPPVPKEVVAESVEITPTNLVYMLSGIEKGGTTATITGKDYLQYFSPTPSSGLAHNVPAGYNNNAKLAHSGGQTKASMFSGAMRRVVGAIEGLGKITDSSFYYTPWSGSSRVAQVQYQSSGTVSHGVYKADTRNWWLIEISATRGVLAMPLPLITSTTSKSYRTWLVNKKDTGSIAVVDEFGGLPSGETFPTGTALTTAITKGKVLQLMTASDLDPYYKAVVGETHSFEYGWAFSNTGHGCANVRFNYFKRTGASKFSINGELFSLQINLTKHGTPIPPTGTATLIFQHSGKMSKWACMNLWMAGASERLSTPLSIYSGLPIDDDALSLDGEKDGFGCYVHVFYRGERIEYVKYMPQVRTQMVDTRWVYTYPRHGDPCGGQGEVFVQDPYGTAFSPESFISSSYDIRHMQISYRPPYTDPSTYVGLSDPGGPAAGGDVSFWYQWNIYDARMECVANPDFGLGDAAWVAQSSGGWTGPTANFISKYVAIIPGYTRDAVVLMEFVSDIGWTADGVLRGLPGHTTPGYTTAKGIFADFIMDIPVDAGFKFPATPGESFYYGIVVAPGSKLAYIMTKGMYTPPDRSGGADVSPGYSTYNVLSGTSPVSNLDQHTFIGNYTA